MAIDASIPLQIQPVALNSPLAAFSQMYALKNAGIDTRLNQLKLGQAEQADADDKAVRTAISGNTSKNPDGTISLNRAGAVGELYQTAPTQGLSLQNQFTMQDLAARKSAIDLQKVQLENSKTKTDLLGQIANGITDQASYEAGTAQAVKLGLVQPGEFPPQYDPQIVRQAQMNAVTAKDHLDQEQTRLAFQEKQHMDEETARNNQFNNNVAAQNAQTSRIQAGTSAAAQRETSRHNVQAEGIERTGQQIQLRGQNLSGEGTMVGEFNSVTAPFRQQAAAYNQIQSLTNQVDKNGKAKSPNGIDDLALMYSVNKLYDPNSAVKEGELMNVQNATGPLAKFGNLYNSVVKGQKLTPTQRAEIVDQAKTLMQTAEQQHTQTVQSFQNRALRNGFDPQSVAPDYRSVFSPNSSTGQSQRGTIRAIDTKGVVHEAPAGTALPAGWKLQ